MKSLKRKAAALMAAVMFILCLAGCGGSGSSSVDSLAKIMRTNSVTSHSKNLDTVAAYLSDKNLNETTINAALSVGGVSDATISVNTDGTYEAISAVLDKSESMVDFDMFSFIPLSGYTSEQMKALASGELKEKAADLKANIAENAIQYCDDNEEISDYIDDCVSQIQGNVIALYAIYETSIDVAMSVAKTGVDEWLVVLDASCEVEILPDQIVSG